MEGVYVVCGETDGFMFQSDTSRGIHTIRILHFTPLPKTLGFLNPLEQIPSDGDAPEG